jgi:hypothetical protein
MGQEAGGCKEEGQRGRRWKNHNCSAKTYVWNKNCEERLPR